MQDTTKGHVDNVVRVDFESSNSIKSKSVPTKADNILNERKKALFEKWLLSGTVCVLLDARQSGVEVPKQFASRGDLRLNFCYKFQIHDFSFNQSSVWATLSFDDGEFFCRIPWDAVYALQSMSLDQGAVWFDCFPADLDQERVLGISKNAVEQEPASIEDSENEMEEKSCNVISFNSARKKSIKIE